jgi:hypothetical protein
LSIIYLSFSCRNEVLKEFKETRKVYFEKMEKMEENMTGQMKMNWIVPSVLLGISILTQFVPSLRGKVTLNPQGFRGDTNRFAMGITMLLSVCTIFLAPIVGCKKICNICKPITDVLSKVPYATWTMKWLRDWWEGEADFDDLPQSDQELYKMFGAESYRMKEALNDLADERDIMARKNPHKEESPRIKLSDLAVWQKQAELMKMCDYRAHFKDQERSIIKIKDIKTRKEIELDVFLSFEDFTACFNDILFAGIWFENKKFDVLKDFQTASRESYIRYKTSKLNHTQYRDEPSTSSEDDDDDIVDFTKTPQEQQMEAYMAAEISKREKLVQHHRDCEELAARKIRAADKIASSINNNNNNNTVKTTISGSTSKTALLAPQNDGPDNFGYLLTQYVCSLVYDYMYEFDPEGRNAKFEKKKDRYDEKSIDLIKRGNRLTNIRKKASDVCEAYHKYKKYALCVVILALGVTAVGVSRRLIKDEEVYEEVCVPPIVLPEQGKGKNKNGGRGVRSRTRKRKAGQAHVHSSGTENEGDNFSDDDIHSRDRNRNGLFETIGERQWNAYMSGARTHDIPWSESWANEDAFPLRKQGWWNWPMTHASEYNRGCYHSADCPMGAGKPANDAYVHCDTVCGGREKCFHSEGCYAMEAGPIKDGIVGPVGKDYETGKTYMYVPASQIFSKTYVKKDPSVISDFVTRVDTKDVQVSVPNAVIDASIPTVAISPALLPQSLPVPPVQMDDAVLRRAIYEAKHRKKVAPAEQVDIFCEQATKLVDDFKKQLQPQSFKPTTLAHGVYQIFVNGKYACTGTHVSNKMYVVMHSVSEDVNADYLAVNNQHTFSLDGKKMKQVNKEIVSFPVNGYPSVFKNKDFVVPTKAEIVTVLGFGDGNHPEPDALIGFASVGGWCNAKTRRGDCSAPVLTIEGKILGFWTHGNGVDFGRFEPVTSEFKESLKSDATILTLQGMDFPNRPLSPLN